MALRRIDHDVAMGDTLPRNGRGQPLILVDRPSPTKKEPDRVKQVLTPYTRMTTFIDAIDDKGSLTRWGKRMALVGGLLLVQSGGLDVDEVLSKDLTDVDDKKWLDGAAEKAAAEAGAHKKRDRGSVLHKLSECVDRGEQFPEYVWVDGELHEVTQEDLLDMEAYQRATRGAGLLLTGSIETPTVLDELKIAGTPDRIGYYAGPDPDGNTCGHVVVDLKTGRTDYGAGKMAAQLGGYSRSKFYDRKTGERTAMPEDLNLNWGIILNLRPGSQFCEVMWINLETGWRHLLLCKEIRAARNEGRRVLRPWDLSETAADEGEDDGGE